MNAIERMMVAVAACVALSACHDESTATGDGENGVYYWRTTLTLNDAEREFLAEHDVKRMYVRFFDVNRVYSWEIDDNVVPQATIEFVDSMPSDLEIVPTVYITVDAMQEMTNREGEYAEKMIKRIMAMCRKVGIEVNEIQLDCDWTRSTREGYYRLCEAMRAEMDTTMSLSSTIRLHQLTQAPPPVDRGVLMVYNTGNLTEMTTDNSIFSPDDIGPYLNDDRLSDYQLPLDVAYPVYGWTVKFERIGEDYCFGGLIRDDDVSCYGDNLKRVSDNVYEATADVAIAGEVGDDLASLKGGDRIRVERPNIKDIMKIKKKIDKKLKNKPHNNILYHLDANQYNHYSDSEISEIYTCN